MRYFLKDIYAITWPGLRFLRHHWLEVTVTSMVTPLLYVLAFGYGLGANLTYDGYSYVEFIIPGVVALTTMSVSFSGASSKLSVERMFYKSFNEYIMAPVSFNSIIIGKANIGVIRGMLSGTLLLIFGYLMEPTISISAVLILCMLLSCFVFSLLGVMIALMVKSHQSMTTFTRLVITPMTFLCGTFFSLDGLPEAVRAILYCLPLTDASALMRATALGWDFPWLSFIILVLFGIMFFIGCRYNIKRRVE